MTHVRKTWTASHPLFPLNKKLPHKLATTQRTMLYISVMQNPDTSVAASSPTSTGPGSAHLSLIYALEEPLPLLVFLDHLGIFDYDTWLSLLYCEWDIRAYLFFPALLIVQSSALL